MRRRSSAATVHRKAGKAASDAVAAASKAAAIPMAAAVTIGKRMPVLARLATHPSPKDIAETQRMVMEKAAASVEIATAMVKAAGIAAAQTTAAMRSASPPKLPTRAGGLAALSPVALAQAWTAWGVNLTTAAFRPWWMGAEMLNKSLAPVHRRVVANAKRLSKHRKLK